MVGNSQSTHQPHVWLRAESKQAECRTALTPRCARQLRDAGFQITVERSEQRAIPLVDYEEAGCEIVEPHAWKREAPHDAFVLGLKELEPDDSPLIHRHIHFGHVYKQQRGWERALHRYAEGGGELLDLEYLVDKDNRRVAAFGHWAGYAGAALSLFAWSGQRLGTSPPLDRIAPRKNSTELLDDVRRAKARIDTSPRVMVMGALGRSGRGAVELCRAAGVEVLEWDLAETQKGGPFSEILDADIFLNCVFVQTAIPPFITTAMLDSPDRRLGVICDVSCDPYSESNPLPIYETCTSFREPLHRLRGEPNPLDLIAIDHLPSLLPVESSEDFCSQLLPHLLDLKSDDGGIWSRARQMFVEKMELSKQSA